MSSTKPMDPSIRERILSNPDTILEDPDLMRALVAANDRAMGGNIVDLRGIAMERLEARLDRLEQTHRSVIAAAYENLSGTNQIHRAVLNLLDAPDFKSLLKGLSDDVAPILQIDAIRLVLESSEGSTDPALASVGQTLVVAPRGFVADYLKGSPERAVTLRKPEQAEAVFGAEGRDLGSEACLRLDLGTGRLPGLMVMGANDPDLFTPQQGTDLLAFFAGVFERLMRRWLG